MHSTALEELKSLLILGPRTDLQVNVQSTQRIKHLLSPLRDFKNLPHQQRNQVPCNVDLRDAPVLHLGCRRLAD